MPIHPIRTHGDPVLRFETKPVLEVDETVRMLAIDMLETM